MWSIIKKIILVLANAGKEACTVIILGQLMYEFTSASSNTTGVCVIFALIVVALRTIENMITLKK